MAFEAKNFVICSRFQLFKACCNLWLYTTTDSLEDCLSENYFRPRMNTKNQDSPKVGDVIQCILGDGALAYLKVISKTEKPYNITVEKTYLENEAEIYEAIYTAANKGEQLYQTGVWYAKMYSETVVPTGAEYDGRNYADFSQVDSDNNPIVVIYEGVSGAWVEIETITPPSDANGYLPITSKMWDIEEQDGQQGGEVLWSYSTRRFTPFPRIISFDSIRVTGDSTVEMPNNPSNDQIVNKDYVDSAIEAADIVKSIDAKIIGTPAINNSIVSNFSGTNYIELPGVFKLGDSNVTSFEIGGNLTTSSDTTNGHLFFSSVNPLSGYWSVGIAMYISAAGILNVQIVGAVNIQPIAGVTSLSPNTKYYIKLEYDGTNYKIWLSEDGLTYDLENSVVATEFPTPAVFQLGRTTYPVASIDMSGWYIKENNMIIWSGMDSVGLSRRAVTGHEVIEFQAPTSLNDYTWYRKYADGWVEQGGIVPSSEPGSAVVTLPVEMADTNYQILLTSEWDSGNNGSLVMWESRQTTSFTRVSTNNSGVFASRNTTWTVCGMYE